MNNKKNVEPNKVEFEPAEVEVIVFATEDVITTSIPTITGPGHQASQPNDYEIYGYKYDPEIYGYDQSRYK